MNREKSTKQLTEHAASRMFPLDIENVGEDTYFLMSWGHHNFQTFMDAVAKCYPTWPMGLPRHTWYVKHPKKGCKWAAVECAPSHRKAIPATVTMEAYGKERYGADTTGSDPLSRRDRVQIIAS